MPRLNWSSTRKGGARWALSLLLASQFLTGCQRHTPQASRGSSSGAEKPPTTAQTSIKTNLSACLEEMSNDRDAAVQKFLAIDLTQGKLFSQNAPLSYSESDFSKLDRAAAEQLFKQATADLGLLKQLAREIKTRRDEARMSGKSELADQYNVKLLQL